MRSVYRKVRNRIYRPPTLGRIVGDAAILLALHFTLAHVLAHARLLEHLLSPGPGSRLALAATATFLLLRFFVLVLGPGWIAARLWLLISRPRPARHD
jgi:hypothetical protein